MKRVLLLAFTFAIAATPSGAKFGALMGVDTGVAGAAYSGPGNVVSGAIAWWGLRAYNAAYATGLGKIACVSLPATGTCLDVLSDANGNFNLAGQAGLSTCNNSTVLCTIKTFYDQSGAASCAGACDITQVTQANQAVLVLPGGCTSPVTTRHCATGGATTTYTAIGAITVVQPFTISTSYLATNNFGDLFDNGIGTSVMAADFGANTVLISANTANQTVAATDNSYHAVHGVYNGALSDLNVDGSSNTGTNIGSVGIPGTTIKILTGVHGSFQGKFLEMGIWPSAFSTPTSASMSSNQHTYWGF